MGFICLCMVIKSTDIAPFDPMWFRLSSMWAWIIANYFDTSCYRYARSMSMIYVCLKPWDDTAIGHSNINVTWWINLPVGRTMHAPSNPNMPSCWSPIAQQGLWCIHPAQCPKESGDPGNWRYKTLLSTLKGDWSYTWSKHDSDCPWFSIFSNRVCTWLPISSCDFQWQSWGGKGL